MWLFYFNVFLILFLGLLIKPRQGQISSSIYIFLVMGFFACLAMFRSAYVGNDTRNYINLFLRVAKGDNFSSFRYEVGYLFLNKILSYISNDPQIVLIVVSAFMYFSFGRFIYKYSKIPWLSVLMFFSLRYFDLTLSGIREFVALAILTYSYDFIRKKSFVKFAVVVAIAMLFHTSAFVFIFAYSLSRIKLTKKVVFFSAIVVPTIFVFFNAFLALLFKWFPQYAHYTETTYLNKEIRLASVLSFALTLSILIFSKMQRVHDLRIESSIKGIQISEFNFYDDADMSIYLFFSCIILLLSFMGTIFERFDNIYGLFAIIYFPNTIYRIKLRQDQNYAFILLVVIVIFVLHIWVIHTFRPEWQSTFPYSVFWDVKNIMNH